MRYWTRQRKAGLGVMLAVAVVTTVTLVAQVRRGTIFELPGGEQLRRCIVDPTTGGGLASVVGTICTGPLGTWVKTGSGDTAWEGIPAAVSGSVITGNVGVTIDGGGSAISTGFQGCTSVAYSGTITGWSVLSTDAATPTSGSLSVDLWIDRQASYPPTDADSVTASAPISMTTATNAVQDNVSTWTTAFTGTVANPSVWCWNVDSVTSVTRVQVVVFLTKS